MKKAIILCAAVVIAAAGIAVCVKRELYDL